MPPAEPVNAIRQTAGGLSSMSGTSVSLGVRQGYLYHSLAFESRSPAQVLGRHTLFSLLITDVKALWPESELDSMPPPAITGDLFGPERGPRT